MLRSRLLLPAVVAALAPAVADAAEPSTGRVIQVRKYGFTDELRLSVGTMPLDPFLKGWTFSLAHTRHLSDFWAWETLHVSGALLTSTSLRDRLVGSIGVLPRKFSAPRLVVTTGIEATPLYGKQVLFNRDTAHVAALVGLYGGVMFGDRETFEETLEDVRPSLGGGIGFRAYLTPAISTRLDARLFASLRFEVEPEDRVELETVALITWSISLGLGDRP